MPTNCKKCARKIERKSPGLVCAGACASIYHARCVGLSDSELNHFNSPGTYWNCPDCRTLTASTSIIAVDNNEPTEGAVNTDILFILKDIQANIKSLNNKYDNLQSTVNAINNQISYLSAELATLKIKANEVDALKLKTESMEKDFEVLNRRLEDLDLYSRKSNIEIQGVHEMDGENIFNIVENIASSIGCPVTPSVIDKAHRVASFSDKKKHKNIIVKFTTHHLRDNFIAAYHTAKKKQTGPYKPGLKLDSFNDPIFVNEHLTKIKRSLLKKARDICKERGYRYCWVRDAVIKVRKNNDTKPVIINSILDLDKIN